MANSDSGAWRRAFSKIDKSMGRPAGHTMILGQDGAGDSTPEPASSASAGAILSAQLKILRDGQGAAGDTPAGS